jgi:periplasmic protein TonB
MTYASNTRRPNPAALAGALGIPAAFGVLLVVGLAVNVVIAPEDPGLEGFTLKPVPIPPPPPDPIDPATPTTSKPQTSAPTTITRPDNIPLDFGISDPIITLPGVDALTGPVVGPVDFGIPGPTPSASPFDPVGAKARGNPGQWVTNDDYRPRWIRESLTGKASFTLSIDASGKVTGCAITRSTGHAVLDTATCNLVSKRARFDAARDGNGKPVSGSFSGTITWNIPN